MTTRYNTTSNRERRKSLRNNPSEPEFRLWQHLRNKNLGVKFRRQFGVDQYILDFYSPSLKLAIEIDGDSHYRPSAQQYDAQRSARLGVLGIRVVRFTNAEVMNEIEGVLEVIRRAVAELAPR